MTLDTIGIMLVPAISTVIIIWRGGVMVGKVQAAVERLASIENKLDDVQQLKIDVGIMKGLQERFRSDHRELSEQVDRIRDRLPSINDG